MLGSMPRTKRNIFTAKKENIIEKILPVHWHQPIIIFFFFAFIAAALLAPIASENFIPNLADYMNHLAAIIQAKTALAEGQFPLRVAPYEQSGWRYPFYQFYSPTTYTFAGLIYLWLTPANPLIAYKITMWCAIVAGGLYMYRLANWFIHSVPAAVLAGVVYIYAPYYIIIVNHLGSINETVALGILPAALYYTLQRYYYPNKSKILIQMGLVWYLLITTHIVTFVYTSLFVGILLLLITYKNHRHWKNLVSVGLAYGLGCLLAMWFLAPVGLLEKYFIVGETYSDASYLNLFHPLLSHLLFSAAATTSGYRSALLTIHPSVGWPILIAVALCCYGLFKHQTSGSRRADYWMPAFLVLFFISFMMVWSPFDFWKWMPQPLLVAQHSWRLLAQVIWVGALLFAWAICWLFKNRLDIQHIILGTLLIVLSTNSWFPVAQNAQVTLVNFIKNPMLIYNQHSYSLNFEKYKNLVGNIDNMLIDPNAYLKLNVPYTISRALLGYTNDPSVVLQAQIPAKMGGSHLQLLAEINGIPVGMREIKTGLFKWEIPLVSTDTTGKKLTLLFKIQDSDKQKLPADFGIPIDSIILTGFMKPAEKLDVAQMQPYCQQKNTVTDCKLNVPSSIHLLELPVLYYPNLLSVKVNGVSVSYQGVLNHGYLMTGIVPQAGKINSIQVRFRGLLWANIVSWVAWSVWLLLLLQMVVVFFKHKKVTSGRS